MASYIATNRLWFRQALFTLQLRFNLSLITNPLYKQYAVTTRVNMPSMISSNSGIFFKVFRFQMCSTLNKVRWPVFPSSQPCWGEIIGNVSVVHYLIHNYTQSSPARSMRISWRLMLVLPSLNSQSGFMLHFVCDLLPMCWITPTDCMTLLNLILCGKGRQQLICEAKQIF